MFRLTTLKKMPKIRSFFLLFFRNGHFLNGGKLFFSIIKNKIPFVEDSTRL